MCDKDTVRHGHGPHEKLLDEWAQRPHHANSRFVADGIIDTERWAKARCHILFVLKDANDPDGTVGWDLRHKIREEWGEPKGKMWWTAAYWAYGIQNSECGSVPEFPCPDGVTGWTHVADALLSTAVVNIKKSPGSGTANTADLAQYAKEDGDLIVRQIELIKPDLVVCGSTWHFMRSFYPDAENPMDRIHTVSGLPFIDFWHPAVHWPDQLTYFGLCGLVQAAGIL